MTIWLIEVQNHNNSEAWTPLYAICYDKELANKKLIQKRKFLPKFNFRIAKYERIAYEATI